ncbi:hypothetical protein OK349_15220 [Sphingomonas sp. BT-65]|uniref:hypothetical protein n=1 Tax=Sphingomonas sp. BT-65 TaxID=2989821 RepID=UPI002235EA85|nr:hypothetical protein [Sphingomonas sp. BT-65]MCW4463063.1 hypothetical protein [Sphingomonas sp. BT-65]
MTLLEKMDRLVYATRLDRLIFMKMQPRAFRWTPLLVIAALIVGYVLMAKTGVAIAADFLIGWLIFYGAIVAAGLLRALGPRFTATVNRPLDERELMVKARAHATSGVVLAMIITLGCFYMASTGVPWLWHPQFMDWFNLGFGIQAVSTLLPTWIASWLEPAPVVDPDD